MNSEQKSQNERKFLLIGPKTKTITNFRGDLIKDIKKHDYEIVVIAPEKDCLEFFEKNDIKIRLINLDKNSTSIKKNLDYYKNLKKIIKEEKPDKVFSFTIKPVIFGSIAAKRAGVKEIYSLVCGLGLLFSSNALNIRFLRFLAGFLYKYALKFNDVVFFQNKDDIDEFVKHGYVKKEKCELVNGSGVNLEKFKRNQIPKNKMCFIMVSRILKEKGVLEYFEAAKITKEKYPEVEFMYVGAIDKNKNAIKIEELQQYIEKGIVNYIQETNEVEKYVAESNVFVLPTYYREGIPRTLLEATAMGRPIITTDTPGCRETIIDGENGLFVEPKNANDLAEKMEWMIKNSKKLQTMGDKSYDICLKKFEIGIINNQMMKAMRII